MHSHPANKGQPSASPQGVVSSHTPNASTPINSGNQQADVLHNSTDFPRLLSAESSQSRTEQGGSAHWVEQLQLALAIANPELLQQLVLHCHSPLVASHQLGSIRAEVSVPVDGVRAVDSVLNVEVISCELSQESDPRFSRTPDKPINPNVMSLESGVNPVEEAIAQQRALVNQICRETKLKTLGMNIPLPDAIAILQYATFSLPDIQRILNLPYNGWHRSWWAMVDPSVDQTLECSGVNTIGFTIPFKRLVRSRRYADGTVMLQYKDQFSHIAPPCFRTQQKSVVVHIQRPEQSMSEILAWMNHARTALNADYGLLLYYQLSALEQQALRNQGIYLYHCAGSDPVAPSPIDYQAIESKEPIRVNVLADCRICCQQHCPMHGQEASPVTACRLFRVN